MVSNTQSDQTNPHFGFAEMNLRFAEMNEMGIDVSGTTAEAGRRKDKSAGESASGVQYRREPGPFIDKNRVSSFKNAADWKYSPRNAADKELVQLWRDGKISEEQVDAEMILSTMLHEVQHLIDAEVKSDTGTGFNSDGSPKVRQAMRDEYEKNLKFLVTSKQPSKMKVGLSLLHELIYEPVKIDDVIGGPILGARDEKFSINEVLDSIYGADNSYDKSQITELGNIKSMRPDQVIGLDKIFKHWSTHQAAMETFPPDHKSHDIAKKDAKLEFIQRISGTVPSDKPSADFYNSDSLMTDMVGPTNKDNKLLRANAIYHMLNSGEFDGFIKDYYATINNPIKLTMSQSDSEIYRLEGGEVKSRLVQARRDMSSEDRKAMPPYKMLDRDEEQIWFSDTYGNYNPYTKDQ